jgi:hypothetical protein
MAGDDERKPWSERDLLVLYAGLSMGTSVSDIAASLNRGVEDVLERAAALKSSERQT